MVFSPHDSTDNRDGREVFALLGGVTRLVVCIVDAGGGGGEADVAYLHSLFGALRNSMHGPCVLFCFFSLSLASFT